MRSRADVAGHSARAGRVPRAGGRTGRRRTAVIMLAVIGLVTAAAIVMRPMVDEALKEITLPLRHEDVIRQQARDKSLDPALIAAVIYRESKFRDVTSKAGAKGLMQILPSTAHFIARTSGGTEFEQGDLANPQINISYGAWYLRYLLDRYEGNTVAAIAAYNAGHGRVDRWGGKSLVIDDIRFTETVDYTRDVLDKRGDYASEYPRELGL